VGSPRDIEVTSKTVDLASKVKELTQQAKTEALGAEESRSEGAKKLPEEGRYVYCIIPWDGDDRNVSFGHMSIEDGGEVYAIPCGNIAAVVSNSPFKEYLLTEDNVYAHSQVITSVMQEYPVLPMAFGMAFRNEKILRMVLERVHDDLKRIMKEIEGKVEFGVQVLLPKEVGFDEDAFASEIEALRQLSTQCKLGKRFSTHLILNAFYLVEKEKVEAFLGAIKTLEGKFEQLKIKCTGPWPPFNFVTIKVGRD